MTTSPILGIPFVSESQSQPNVTHNEAVLALQILSQGVLDRFGNTPAVGPADGDAYIVGSAPTGAWAGRANCIAYYLGGWRFIPGNDSDGTPITMGASQEGLTVYVKDEDRSYQWTGAAWVALLGTGGGALPFYEEGTWTPAFTFATPGDLALTYANQLGWYEREGNIVTANFRVTTSAFTHTTAAGSAILSGLPFTSKNVPSQFGYGVMQWDGFTLGANYFNVMPRLSPGVSAMNFLKSGTTVAPAQCTPTDIPTAGSLNLSGYLRYIRA